MQLAIFLLVQRFTFLRAYWWIMQGSTNMHVDAAKHTAHLSSIAEQFAAHCQFIKTSQHRILILLYKMKSKAKMSG